MKVRGLVSRCLRGLFLLCMLLGLLSLTHAERFVRNTLPTHPYTERLQNYIQRRNFTHYQVLVDSLRTVANNTADSLLLVKCDIWDTELLREDRNFEEALHPLQHALRYARELKDTISIREVYYWLGLIYLDLEDDMVGLAAYREALRFTSERYPISARRQFALYNNIALVYSRQNDYNNALKYYELAINIEDTNLESYRARLYCNMAVLAEQSYDTTLALSALYKAYPLAIATNDSLVLINIHINLAKIYAREGLTDFMNEELAAYQNNYANYQPQSYKIAPYLSDLVEIFTKTGNYKQAKHYAHAVYVALNGERPTDEYREFLLRLADLASCTGEYKKATLYLDSAKAIKGDMEIFLHILRDNNKDQDALGSFTENEDILQKLRHENDLRTQFQNRRIFFLSLAFFLFAFLLLQRYLRVHVKTLRHTREALIKEAEYARQLNQKWTSLENVLNNQRADLAQSAALLQYTLGLLHRNSNKVNQNIQFVKNIQQVLLPEISLIQQAFGEAFLLYLPRDVVSGDFYWYTHTERYELLALVDCAGHGVPGALMSLIGHLLLNKIVKEWHIEDPAQILTTLHTQIHENLGYQTTTYLGHYSMDLSVIRYEHSSRELVFSAASSSMYLSTEQGVKRYRGSIMSAGSTLTNRPFENLAFTIEPGTWLYLTSDGFTDQLNENFRKYGNVRLQETLRNLYEYSADQQLYFLTESLYLHKEGADQADDICFIGIHF